MKLNKVDGRMNGHGIYKHYVNFNYKSAQQFSDIRRWCWEQFGPSDEFEFFHKIKDPNIKWSWLNDKYTMRIYLATDAEAQWFLLKWAS